MRFVRPLKPWQVSTYRIAGIVLVGSICGAAWSYAIRIAMRMVG